MSKVEEPVTDFERLDPNGIYTYADYLLWRFQERVELIRGKIFRMSPGPNTRHQRLSLELTRQFGNFFHRRPCQVFAAPFDVRLPRKKDADILTVVQPDLCVICDTSKLDERGCIGAPDLVAEILSPGNSQREMKEKFEVYEEAGVKEYWILIPWDHLVLVYLLDEKGRFYGLKPFSNEEALASALFPDLRIDLKELFEDQ